MKNFKIYFMMFLSLGILLSCAPEKKTAAVVESPSIDPDAAVSNAYLYVQLLKRFSDPTDANEYTIHDTCSIDSTLIASKTCTMTIPEAELFYSDLKFTVGGSKVTCPIVHFSPYMYERSNNNSYVPPGETVPIDCSVSTNKPPQCYGGTAPNMFLTEGIEFPKYTSAYHLTAYGISSSYVLPSEVKTMRYRDSVNYLATNDLATGARATTVIGSSKERVGGTYRDNWIYCEDYWGAIQFSIKLIIEDEDIDETSTDPANDEYTDWN